MYTFQSLQFLLRHPMYIPDESIENVYVGTLGQRSLNSKTIMFLNGKRAYSNGHRSRTRVPTHLIIYSSLAKGANRRFVRSFKCASSMALKRPFGSVKRTDSGLELSVRPIGRLIRVHRRDKMESTIY